MRWGATRCILRSSPRHNRCSILSAPSIHEQSLESSLPHPHLVGASLPSLTHAFLRAFLIRCPTPFRWYSESYASVRYPPSFCVATTTSSASSDPSPTSHASSLTPISPPRASLSFWEVSWTPSLALLAGPCLPLSSLIPTLSLVVASGPPFSFENYLLTGA